MPPEAAGRPSLIRIRHATLGYHRQTVLEDVDLDICEGDFLGVIGPNGAGKTTLFQSMLGLLPPLQGSIERDDMPLGYVPQREQLDAVFPLTVEELVQMGGYGRLRGLRRLPKAERDYARQCLSEVGLDDRARQLFSSLSGGQRQRALIARGLMVRPRALLLDEPTSGVDHEAADQVMRLLRRLNQEQGLTVLLVAHQFDLVQAYAREVIQVVNGEVHRGSTHQFLAPHSIDKPQPGPLSWMG